MKSLLCLLGIHSKELVTLQNNARLISPRYSIATRCRHCSKVISVHTYQWDDARHRYFPEGGA